jgi:dTDP-4-dehydrorhamnose reductase
MNILILGHNGQLGFELCRKAAKLGIPFVSCDLPDFNITESDGIRAQIERSDCNLVINATAFTAVDMAEEEQELAFAVNAFGPYNLALACEKRDIPLIHVSTDYVFDGNKDGSYSEYDQMCPSSIYGKSKAVGESKIRTALKKHIIIRTAWLYGEHGQNFVKAMLRLGAEKENIDVVCDQIGCPTCAADLAEAIFQIVDYIFLRKPVCWGTYHYTGKGTASWYEFAKEIFKEAKKHRELRIKKVDAISTAQYPTLAVRPKNSVLDCTLIKEAFGIQTKPWQTSLINTLRNLLNA